MSTFVFLSPAVGGGMFYTFSVPVSSSFVQNFALLPLRACQVVFFVCWFGSPPPPLPSVCFIPSSIYYLFLSFTASKDLRGEKEKTKLFSFLCVRPLCPTNPPVCPTCPLQAGL